MNESLLILSSDFCLAGIEGRTIGSAALPSMFGSDLVREIIFDKVPIYE